MQYALIVRESSRDFARRADPTYRDGWIAYTQALIQAGIMAGGAGLTAPETGAVCGARARTTTSRMGLTRKARSSWAVSI